ncbi:MAG: SRPBCC family protein [Gammaproteobacteria bacterium]|nr:SRPBCC family protein [Gammaproteobacteria bacterium]
MLKTILIGLVALIVLVLIYAATRPDDFRVERSVVVAAPAEKIFPLIDTLQNWRAWSPYERKDPAMQRTYAGPASGIGAAYAWKGNKEVGEGRMEIVESTPPSKVRFKLDFAVPFEAHNEAVFALEPVAGSTRVGWTMTGASPFMFKLMGLFVNMDEMIGRDFETGLAALKTQAEKGD